MQKLFVWNSLGDSFQGTSFCSCILYISQEMATFAQKTSKRLRTCPALYVDEIDWPFWSCLFSHLHNWVVLPGWSEAQQVASSKQLLLIFLYKHVCYGSALIGYHVTPLYLLSPLRLGYRYRLFHYCTTEVSALIYLMAEYILNAYLSVSFIVLLCRLNTA